MKKFYVITSNMPRYPFERFVAGSWGSKKKAQRIVKVVEP